MSSAPFGVDFGNHNTVVAVARNRGIEIVVNEVSNRATPTLVGFGTKNRFIGEAGKSQQTSNIKNTVSNIKRIVGLDYNNPDVALEKPFFTVPLVDVDGEVGVKVRFKGEQQEFSSTQLAAMYFKKIQKTVADDTKQKINDVVIAVPSWYTLAQRHAVRDAAKVAGLNPVRIVNELTAAAVGYGVFKTDFEEGKSLKIAFIDIGDSSYEVSVATLEKGNLKVLGSSYDKFFGGRDFDYAIADHFADELDSKYKVKVRENPKSMSRILASAEKLKKILSANTQAPFNVESCINDIDFSSSLTREKLEELVAPLLERVNGPIERALEQAGVSKDEIDFVEVIGGGSRVPALKERIAEIFGKPLSYHLNQDEAIAKGATFICAMHSPTLKVRTFKFTDVTPYSVSYTWDKQEGTEDEDDTLEVFGEKSPFPSVKQITLERTGDFKLKASYSDPSKLPKGTPVDIASWNITGIKVPEGKTTVQIKMKLRNDESGFIRVIDAYTFEEIEVQEEIPYTGEEEKPEDYEPQYKLVKQIVKKDALEITPILDGGLPSSKLNTLSEKEKEITESDDLVFKTQVKRNDIEEYIYEFRSKLDDIYADFVNENEKSEILETLMKTEDWLYDNEDASLNKLIAKYEEIASKGNLIIGRYNQKQNDIKVNAKEDAKAYNKFVQKAQEQPQTQEKPATDDGKMDLDLD